MSQRELAEVTGISEPTIQRLEKQPGELQVLTGTIRKIENALEERGIVFVEGGAVLKKSDK
jgi:predicted transcriptional regulator